MLPGNLFIVSAPSGTGKTTILKRIMAEVPNISFSVSHTTRKPRPAERDGVDYHFVDHHTFTAMRDGGAFLEWAEVHDNLYGTSKTVIAKNTEAGIDTVLDIDVQGAGQIRDQQEYRPIFIFISPPSWKELERRLTGRGSETGESIRLRLDNARQEMHYIDMYDYVLVNDKIESAVDLLRAVILAERSRNRRSAAGLPLVLPPPSSHG